MLPHREAKRLIKTHFHAFVSEALVSGLPNSSPVLPPLVFTVKGSPYTPSVYYRNVEPTTPLPAEEHFMKLALSNVETEQSSLPGGRINGGGTKFTTIGVGVVQLFFSKNNYTTAEEDYLTAIAHEAFITNKVSGVWLKRATIHELAEEEDFFRTNISFDYSYDTHRLVPS